jgi:hypothetical protein
MFGGYVCQRGDMRFRYDKNMRRRLGIYITESYKRFVLIDYISRYLSGYDTAKNTVHEFKIFYDTRIERQVTVLFMPGMGCIFSVTRAPTALKSSCSTTAMTS